RGFDSLQNLFLFLFFSFALWLLAEFNLCLRPANPSGNIRLVVACSFGSEVTFVDLHHASEVPVRFNQGGFCVL
ncbi:hypothetical protein V8C34DRAFT_279372, partial [Trichoderma compactum]